jgi:hypothetical protein
MLNEQEPQKKKKKGLLSEKMGLDQGSVEKAPAAPPMAQPGIFPGSAEGELSARNQEEAVGSMVRSKLKDRKGAPRGV